MDRIFNLGWESSAYFVTLRCVAAPTAYIDPEVGRN